MKPMYVKRRAFAGLAAAAVAGLLLSPVTPARGDGDQESDSWRQDGHPAWLHQASGGGTFTASGGGGESQIRFAFSGRQVNHKGRVKGHFEFHNVTNETSLYMKIVRMEFLDEYRATVGLVMEVYSVSGSPGAGVGDCRAVKLQDNGDGFFGPLVDMTSKLSNKCSGDQLTVFDAAGEPDWYTDFQLIPLNSGDMEIL